MTDQEIIIRLHNMAREVEARDPTVGKELREIADRFAELSKKVVTDEQ